MNDHKDPKNPKVNSRNSLFILLSLGSFFLPLGSLSIRVNRYPSVGSLFSYFKIDDQKDPKINSRNSLFILLSLGSFFLPSFGVIINSCKSVSIRGSFFSHFKIDDHKDPKNPKVNSHNSLFILLSLGSFFLPLWSLSIRVNRYPSVVSLFSHFKMNDHKDPKSPKVNSRNSLFILLSLGSFFLPLWSLSIRVNRYPSVVSLFSHFKMNDHKDPKNPKVNSRNSLFILLSLGSFFLPSFLWGHYQFV